MKQKTFSPEILLKYKSSGLSVREYCRQNSINYHTFRYWLAKDRKPLALPAVRFVELKPPDTGDQWCIHIGHSGIQIQFHLDWKFPFA